MAIHCNFLWLICFCFRFLSKIIITMIELNITPVETVSAKQPIIVVVIGDVVFVDMIFVRSAQ